MTRPLFLEQSFHFGQPNQCNYIPNWPNFSVLRAIRMPRHELSYVTQSSCWLDTKQSVIYWKFQCKEDTLKICKRIWTNLWVVCSFCPPPPHTHWDGVHDTINYIILAPLTHLQPGSNIPTISGSDRNTVINYTVIHSYTFRNQETLKHPQLKAATLFCLLI